MLEVNKYLKYYSYNWFGQESTMDAKLNGSKYNEKQDSHKLLKYQIPVNYKEKTVPSQGKNLADPTLSK